MITRMRFGQPFNDNTPVVASVTHAPSLAVQSD